MLIFLALHEIATGRGDGLRPELLGIIPQKVFCEPPSIISYVVAEVSRQPPVSDKRREPEVSQIPSP